jgi:glycosyltransferase involved in cell wall biosynthesis
MNNRSRSIGMFVAGLDIGGVDGGAESSGVELARHLHQTGDRVTLCVFWRTGSTTEAAWLERLAADKLPVRFMTPPEARRNSGDAGAGLSAIRALLRDAPFEITHAHHEGAALGLAQTRLRQPKPIILRTAHMPRTLEWGVGAPARVLRFVVSGVLFPAALDQEVVVAPWYALDFDRRLVARALKKRCTMINNARSVPVDAPRRRDPAAPVTIGMVGRLVPQKNPGLLIEALPALLTMQPDLDIRAVFIGDGPLRAELESRAQALGVRAAIDFLGQRDDVRERMRTLDIFALPSVWEGLPNVLIEAIAGGVPVVASDIMGVGDVISHGQSGRLFRSGDASALAAALRDAIDAPDQSHAMAVRAQDVLPRFSLRHAADAYRALYDALLARKAMRAARK